jgi:hypothetical protein
MQILLCSTILVNVVKTWSKFVSVCGGHVTQHIFQYWAGIYFQTEPLLDL